jgi:hypothetical protein
LDFNCENRAPESVTMEEEAGSLAEERDCIAEAVKRRWAA